MKRKEKRDIEKLKKEVYENQESEKVAGDLAISIGKLTENDCMIMTGVLKKFVVKAERGALYTIEKELNFKPVLNVLEQAEKMFDDIMKGG